MTKLQRLLAIIRKAMEEANTSGKKKVPLTPKK